MKTFENLYTDFTIITKDNSTSNVTFGKAQINDTQKSVCNMADFTFLDDEMYSSSVASQGDYRLPHNYQPGSLGAVYVLNGGNKYPIKEIHSQEEFEQLASDSSTATIPEIYCVYNDYIKFYPLFADNTSIIYAKYRQVAREMSAANYITGTITATFNSLAIVGSGTTFTSAMVGRQILLPDGLWYKIKTFTNATNIALEKTYEGTTTAGASFTIGDCPIIPDGYQDLLIYKPLETYFMIKGEEKRSSFYKNLYDLMLRDLKSRYLSRSANQVFVKGGAEVKNPNDYPTGLTSA
jgi:hypothetical protein